MKSRIRSRLTFANLIASLALFIALGGGAYAAVSVPKNSVGTEQIQREAVRTGKIGNEAVTGEKIAVDTLGTVPTANSAQTAKQAGRAGFATAAKEAEHADQATRSATSASAESAEQAENAEHAESATDADELGGKPASDYLTSDEAPNPNEAVLGSGETEVGDFVATGPNGGYGSSLVQFTPHLPETVQGGHLEIIESGPTANCPGQGEAAAGYMCVYVTWNYNMTFESFTSTMPGSAYAGPVSGVMLWVSHNNSGNVRGNWAFTAP
jgi:hypothetical protein